MLPFFIVTWFCLSLIFLVLFNCRNVVSVHMKHFRHLVMFFFSLQFLFSLQHFSALSGTPEVNFPAWEVKCSFFLLSSHGSHKSEEDVGESGVVISLFLLVLAVASLWLQWEPAWQSSASLWDAHISQIAPGILVGVGAVAGQEPPPPWRKQIALQFPWVRSQAAFNLNLRASPPDLVSFGLLMSQECSHYLHLYFCMPFHL